MYNDIRGSEWRRWDLHIHTPDTNKNDQFDGSSSEEKWEKYYQDISNYIGDGLDAKRSIAVIGITDYYSIENYQKVVSDNKLPNSIKLVLPNVEMRMTPVSSKSPINIHCIFSPEIVSELNSIFFSRLMFEYDNSEYSATKDDIIRLGRAYKDDQTLDELQAYKFGVNQFIVNPKSLEEVFQKTPQLRKNTIVVVSNSSNDGASGARNHKDYFDGNTSSLNATIQEIYKKSDMIFSANPNDIKYFLGDGVDDKEQVMKKCGSLKPCIHGSDAHCNNKIFEPANKRYCWIKSDPTFEGLKQVVFEPKQRVKISEFMPEEKASYTVIDRVEFNDNDFQTEPIYFNKNLNCIIGGKSTGKSILIQNMARTIDEEQTSKHLETSKKITKNDVDLKVFWNDGKTEGHKIVYIPQTYLNQLSDEKENQTEIDQWIEDILLKNQTIKKNKSQTDSLIKELKISINKTLYDFLNYTEVLKEIQIRQSDIGNKEALENEIKSLEEKKSKIVRESQLSEDDIKLFDDAKQQIQKAVKQHNLLLADKENIINIKNLVVPDTINVSFSKETNEKIENCRKDIMSEADKKWLEVKTNIINDLDARIKVTDKNIIPNRKIYDELKPKIEGNESVKILTQKIDEQNEKLAKIKELEAKKNQNLNKCNDLLDNLCESGNKFKNTYQKYQTIIENNTHEIDGLLFSGEVPFRCNSFAEKLSSIYDTRRNDFRDIFGNIDQFEESKYNKELLKRIITKTVDGTLTLKNGYSPEKALREILDNWYNIVYRVKMDNDFIDQMSPGKKALVLLKILISLAESKWPILIDQPEDDLDNRSIFNDLINFIKEKKIERQIIVVTHNANIVLGSDSENIIIANQEGNDSPNRSKRFEYRSGAIENNSIIYKSDGVTKEDGVLNQYGIQHHICDILEGGETAFEIRKKKYRI